MTFRAIPLVLLASLSLLTGAEPPAGPYYGVLRELPLTEITPEGWLAQFLQRQRDGLAMNYQAAGYPFVPPLWAGVPEKKADWGYYEENAYLVDGVYRCGLLLRDKPLTDLGLANIDYVLAHPQPDGRLGPADMGPITMGLIGLADKKGEKLPATEWPFAIFARAMMADYTVTGNKAILDALTKHYLAQPADFGHGPRDVDNIEAVSWLYGQTGNPQLIALAQKMWENFCKSPQAAEHKLLSYAKADPIKGHGVSQCELTKQPGLLYLYTGKKEYLDALVGGFTSLDRDHVLVDGVVASEEGLVPQRADGVHETCDITDYTWSLGYVLQASGDAKWGDKIERAVFNAGFGAIDKDFKSLQYFSSPNQVISNQTSSSITSFGPANADRMAYRPGSNVQCCAGNVHRFLPNYVARMWMRDVATGGLAATLYGPATVRTTVHGAAVTIKEETGYPFDGTIRLSFTTDQPVKFPLSLRIPSWADGATVTINGQPSAEKPVPGSFLKIEREFKNGDAITLNFPMQVRAENPVAGGISILRGPLVYALKIKDAREAVTNVRNTAPNFPAWNLTPASPWNYALSAADLSQVQVAARPITDFPWTPDTAPVVLSIPAKRVTGWTLTADGKSPPFPAVPLQLANETETVELIPAGATQLRLSVFPDGSAPAPAASPSATP